MKDVEIGTIGEYKVCMSFKEIKKIANKEISRRLKKATEALEAIATHTVIPDAPEDLIQQIQTVNNIAENTLKEIGE